MEAKQPLTFADAVRAAIKPANPTGMTQKELAQAARTSRSAINDILQLRREPGLKVAGRIALVLGLTHQVAEFGVLPESTE